jgi:hypothetical protein
MLACAGGSIMLYQILPNAAPKQLAVYQVHRRMHTLAFDAKTRRIWTVWGSADGDFVQGFTYR